LGSFESVRKVFALSLFLANANFAAAQDQEHKLVDRLLRPNTELQSSSQNKKFLADKKSVDKRATVATFYVQDKPGPKIFAATRSFASQPVSTRSYKASALNISSQNPMANAQRTYATTTTTTRDLPSAGKTSSTRDYSGNRPFLNEGKSQKALSQQKQSLTIEQVRELLNKNK
jgi:hypothetical protein